MKKLSIILAMAACVLTACKPSSVDIPQWWADEDYQYGKAELYNNLPVGRGDIVLLGDDIFDCADWSEIYASPRVKGRGITGDATSHVLARVDSIALHKPSKVLLSVGLNDLAHNDSIAVIKKGIIDIVKRIHHFSPKTEVFWLDVVPGLYLSPEQTNRALELNKQMVALGSKDFTCLTVSASLLNSVTKGEYAYEGRMLNGRGLAQFALVLSETVGLPPQMIVDALPCDKEVSPQMQEYLDNWYGEADKASCKPGTYFLSMFNRHMHMRPAHNGVVFLGNSLTDYAPWSELLAGFPVINRGIAGDRIEGVRLRLDDIAADRPNKIMLMIGTNDLVKFPNKSIPDVWADYEMLIKEIAAKMPLANLYLTGILPMNPKSADYPGFNERAAELNKLLKAGKERYGYIYVDLASELMDENGDLKAEYTTDGCHLSAVGYFIWATNMLVNGRPMVIGNPYSFDKK